MDLRAYRRRTFSKVREAGVRPGQSLYCAFVKRLSQTAIICLSLLLCGVAAFAGTGRITVQISLHKEGYRIGKHIPVTVEITNNGSEGLIVSNLITTDVNNRQGHIEFTVTDSKGSRQSPQLNWVSDSFAPFPSAPDWRRVLGLWLVLFPKDSFSSRLNIDEETFPCLTKPGRYKLSATYSSAGLDYGGNYRMLGLKAQDVTALPFRTWSGKVQSNSVWIRIFPGPKPSEK